MGKNDGQTSFSLPFVGEEKSRIINKAKQQADDILAKARAILIEARSVQTSFDDTLEISRSEARRIGFDEGFRVGRAEGETSDKERPAESVQTDKGSGASKRLIEAAKRLEGVLARFEGEREKYLGGVRDLIHQLKSNRDFSSDELPEALAELLREDSPRAELSRQDEIWLEMLSADGAEAVTSAAVSGAADAGRRGSAPSRSDKRGKGHRRGRNRSR